MIQLFAHMHEVTANLNDIMEGWRTQSQWEAELVI
jgi:hypothetical protein